MIQATFPSDESQNSICSADIDLAEVDFENEASIKKYLDITVDEAKTLVKRLDFIDDDLVPYTWLKFGQAHCHLWLTDAPTKFEKDSSWTDPILESLDRTAKIQLDCNKKWCKIVLESYRYLHDVSEGKYMIMAGAYGPVDLAQMLRGPDIYTDFYDFPEQVKTFLFQCADVLRDFQEKIWDYVKLRDQGEILWGMYISIPSLALSIDGSCMVSRELFEEFELPAIIRQFRGIPGVIHTHLLGRHLLPSLITLDNVRVIDVGTDPNTPRCMDIVDELADMSARTGKAFYMSSVNDGVRVNEIYENIELLKKGRFIVNSYCDNLKQAQDLVKFVRSHSVPLE